MADEDLEQSGVAAISDPTHELPGQFSPIGWVPPDGMTLEEWLDFGDYLVKMENRTTRQLSVLYWVLADWMRHGEQTWPEEHTQGLQDFADRFSVSTQRQIRWVGRIPQSSRLDALPFWHHAEVVGVVPPGKEGDETCLTRQRALLQQCLEEGWTRKELAQAAKGGEQKKPSKKPVGGAHKLLWADPPWNTLGEEGLIHRRPPLAPDAVLMMWADGIERSVSLCQAWGLKVRDHSLWETKVKSSGWVSHGHRVLLLATCGTPAEPSQPLPGVFHMLEEVEEWARSSWGDAVEVEWT